MASEAEIQFVVNAIVDAGFTAETWPLFVSRSKLVTELRALESDHRNMQVVEDAQNTVYLDEVIAKQAELAVKQAEIDAL